jgi:hypothetical protein
MLRGKWPRLTKTNEEWYACEWVVWRSMGEVRCVRFTGVTWSESEVKCGEGEWITVQPGECESEVSWRTVVVSNSEVNEHCRIRLFWILKKFCSFLIFALFFLFSNDKQSRLLWSVTSLTVIPDALPIFCVNRTKTSFSSILKIIYPRSLTRFCRHFINRFVDKRMLYTTLGDTHRGQQVLAQFARNIQILLARPFRIESNRICRRCCNCSTAA